MTIVSCGKVLWWDRVQVFWRQNDRIGTLLPMLDIYLSAADSTCGIERDLGALTRILEAHAGPTDEAGSTISYCTELFLDGPPDETGIATRVGEVLMPTDFTRECVRLWVSVHGRRFWVYQQARPGHAHTGAPQEGLIGFSEAERGTRLAEVVSEGQAICS